MVDRYKSAYNRAIKLATKNPDFVRDLLNADTVDKIEILLESKKGFKGENPLVSATATLQVIKMGINKYGGPLLKSSFKQIDESVKQSRRKATIVSRISATKKKFKVRIIKEKPILKIEKLTGNSVITTTRFEKFGRNVVEIELQNRTGNLKQRAMQNRILEAIQKRGEEAIFVDNSNNTLKRFIIDIETKNGPSTRSISFQNLTKEEIINEAYNMALNLFQSPKLTKFGVSYISTTITFMEKVNTT